MPKFKARYITKEMATPNVAILSFEPESPIQYRAGQLFHIHLGSDSRPYSVANAPVNERNTVLEFHVGLGYEFTQNLIKELPLNSEIEMSGPYGGMTFQENCESPILAIAGGTGLGQMQAICQAALQSSRNKPVYLFHGARDEASLYKHDELLALSKSDNRFHYFAATSDIKPSNSNIFHGYIGDAVAQKFEDLSDFRAYICGPHPMVVHSQEIVSQKGIDPACIHVENWGQTKTQNTG